MELIAKTTQKCDMACTFCAASGCKEHIGVLEPVKIAEAADMLHIKSIILAGGENLTLPVSYFEKLLSITQDDIKIELVTNLKDFYLHPDKWETLFRNPRIYVSTSFNYGAKRRWDKEIVYDESLFRKVMKLFNDRIGYTPMFIAVIDQDNIDTWLKHVLLAKELDTTCRLNNALKIGRETKYFPRSKLYKIYTQIVDLGLDQYEVSARDRKKGHCPENGNLLCQSTIRVIKKMPDGSIKYFACDDDSNRNTNGFNTLKPMLPKESCLTKLLKAECSYCPLCRLCNGCQSNQQQIEDVESYCREMKSIQNKLIEQGWCI